jgi:hypothetical protein
MKNQIIESQTQNSSTTDMVMNHQAMIQMQNLAELMANGKSTVPAHLKGSPADCMAIIMQAAQWQMNPFAVAQKTHLVSGTLGYEAQLVNAVITSSRAVTGRFHYRYGGNWQTGGDGQAHAAQKGVNVNMGVTIDGTCWVQVGAVLAGEKEICWGEPLYPSTVTTRNSPLWKTNPKQQSSYLAVKYWARLYAPAVILGVYSSDEFEDTSIRNAPGERVINPNEAPGSKTKSSTLNSILNSGDAPVDDDQPSKAYESNSRALQDCADLDELAGVGAHIARAVENNDLFDNEKQLLTAEYQMKKRALTPADVTTGEIAQ